MDIDLFRFTLSTEVEMLFRIAFAALVGGVIGFERRRAARPAGIRTLALVSMGAAAFTVVSIFGFADGDGQFRDPARIAAQVATGVGFIGAGTMVRSGATVRGLTTAAGIWMSAALGVAAGAGMYVFALGGAAIAVAILLLLPRRIDSEEKGDAAG
ncbi:MAG: MgtC/SapB family protein [Chloroflexi bacterium]|nr:MgtC/SapB family protein [Chloroflexota bacterium]